jgi:hypothetical protein
MRAINPAALAERGSLILVGILGPLLLLDPCKGLDA